MVRLKAQPAPIQAMQVQTDFNSKVVRLKENIARAYRKRYNVFQFQSGTIKRGRILFWANLSPIFQFQSGTIKSLRYFSQND